MGLFFLFLFSEILCLLFVLFRPFTFKVIVNSCNYIHYCNCIYFNCFLYVAFAFCFFLLSCFLPLYRKHYIIQYSLLSAYVILLLKILSDCLWVLNMCNKNLLQPYSYLMRIPYNRYIMTEYFQFSPFVYMTAIYFTYLQAISSVQFSSVAQSFLTLQSQVLKHTRLPCPSPTPGTYSNSCPLSLWCHPTISSSVIPFSSCLQSFSASGSLQLSQFFESGGQSIGVSASASAFPMNIQDWSPLGRTDWITLLFKGLSKVFSNTTIQKHQFFSAQLSL